MGLIGVHWPFSSYRSIHEGVLWHMETAFHEANDANGHKIMEIMR